MYFSKKILAMAVGFVLVGAMIAVLGLLYIELGQANADLRETSAELQQTVTDLEKTTDTLAASKEANDNLTREYTAVATERDTLEEAKAGLESELAHTRDDLVATEKNLSDEVAKTVRLEGDLATSRAEARDISTQLRDSEQRWNDLDADYQALTRRYSTLDSDHQTLTREHQALNREMDSLKRRFAADLDALQVRYNALVAENGSLEEVRTEIARLERARQPLILGRNDTERTWMACTGSMEPKITCLDEVTWLTDFNPAEIVIGATIAYGPTCWGDQNGVAHRVTDITTSGGVHYFRTKGDALFEDDGCWIAEHDVVGYMIEIHKNVNTENAHLRNSVNGARSAWLNAEAVYEERHAYYCGNLTAEACAPLLSSGARQEMSRVWNLAERAWQYYDCWYQNAYDSEYPGHIPYSC